MQNYMRLWRRELGEKLGENCGGTVEKSWEKIPAHGLYY